MNTYQPSAAEQSIIDTYVDYIVLGQQSNQHLQKTLGVAGFTELYTQFQQRFASDPAKYPVSSIWPDPTAEEGRAEIQAFLDKCNALIYKPNGVETDEDHMEVVLACNFAMMSYPSVNMDNHPNGIEMRRRAHIVSMQRLAGDDPSILDEIDNYERARQYPTGYNLVGEKVRYRLRDSETVVEAKVIDYGESAMKGKYYVVKYGGKRHNNLAADVFEDGIVR